MLYLGSDHELPLLPSPDWESIKEGFPANAPHLIIESIHKDKADVMRHFKEKHILYAGSFEGCGCGFNRCVPDIGIPEDDEESRVSLRSRETLCEYIARHKVSSLYGCWDGDQSLPKEGEIDVTIETLLDRSFEFPERIMMSVGTT